MAPQDLLEYDPEAEIYRAEYLDGADPPSQVVTQAIAVITGNDILELDPLHDVVDPDALDRLFLSPARRAGRGDGVVTFPYWGHHITVRSYGLIEIQPAEEAE